jgi:hypothetical protein
VWAGYLTLGETCGRREILGLRQGLLAEHGAEGSCRPTTMRRRSSGACRSRSGRRDIRVPPRARRRGQVRAGSRARPAVRTTSGRRSCRSA